MDQNNQEIQLRGVLKKIGIGALAVMALADVGLVASAVIDGVNSRKGSELGLVLGGIHLKEGNHNFVITDQFYSHIKYEDEADQKLVIDSFKTTYDNLNYLNSKKIRFTLCTQSKEASEKFNLPLVSSYSKYDVPLYICNGDIDNNPKTAGKTVLNTEYVTCVAKDSSITFKKKSLFAVYSYLGKTEEEIYSVSNAYAYTICAHETLHAMGLEHRANNSILYPYIPSPYKDFTDYDKELLVKYNQIFYNTTPEWVTNDKELKPVAKPKEEIPEDAYTFSHSNSDDLCR